jgi:hypothetical protein
VIGVGVKSSTSDLLIANCDEFIYYDDLVRKEEQRRGRRKAPAKQGSGKQPPAAPAPSAPAALAVAESAPPAAPPAEVALVEAAPAASPPVKTEEEKKQKIWGSIIKQALKRQRPGFNETYHGFKSFSQLLEEAQARKLIEIEKDEKSGGYVVKAVP